MDIKNIPTMLRGAADHTGNDLLKNLYKMKKATQANILFVKSDLSFNFNTTSTFPANWKKKINNFLIITLLL